jgi:hypothetical protein
VLFSVLGAALLTRAYSTVASKKRLALIVQRRVKANEQID